MFTKKHFAQLIAAIQVISLFAMPVSVFGADYTTPINVGSGSTLEIKSTDYDNVNITPATKTNAIANGGILNIFNDSSSVSNNVTVAGGNDGTYGLDAIHNTGIVNINGQDIRIEGTGHGCRAINNAGTVNIGTENSNNVYIGASTAGVAADYGIGGIYNDHDAGTNVMGKNIEIVTSGDIGHSVGVDNFKGMINIGTNATEKITISGDRLGLSSSNPDSKIVVNAQDIDITTKKFGISGWNITVGTDETATVNIVTESGGIQDGWAIESKGNNVIKGKQIDIVAKDSIAIITRAGDLQIGGNDSVVNVGGPNDEYGIDALGGTTTIDGKDITISSIEGLGSGTVKVGTQDTAKVKIGNDTDSLLMDKNTAIVVEGQDITLRGNVKYSQDNDGVKSLSINKGSSRFVVER